MGIDAFIEEQLAPERLDDSALTRRLAEVRNDLNRFYGAAAARAAASAAAPT